MHVRWQESVDHGLRAIELATGDENPLSDMVSRYWTANCLLGMGDPDAARPHILVLRDLAERRSTHRQNAGLGFAPITSLSCLEGDWKAGREFSDRGLAVSPLNFQVLFPRVMLEHETGEAAQGDAYLDRLLDATRPFEYLASARMPMTIAAIARITGVPTAWRSPRRPPSRILQSSLLPITSPCGPRLGRPCWPCRRVTNLRRRSIMLTYRDSEAR